ncbi:hypothetical protein Catovirus_2_209 [Catovirus CTV1]|uniref:Uncharacterized protein n=1 Tax=Catovirus CTV1 TaxID=1977631 RepID=A0A1V0SC08_9VIRU|nr:hypothetical protein Catovirus_2_209 [Catovirus CTV1]
MDNSGKILGMNTDTFFALIFLLLFIILGIVSFQFYGYVSAGGPNSALSAGTGVGISLFPNNNRTQQPVMIAQPGNMAR